MIQIKPNNWWLRYDYFMMSTWLWCNIWFAVRLMYDYCIMNVVRNACKKWHLVKHPLISDFLVTNFWLCYLLSLTYANNPSLTLISCCWPCTLVFHTEHNNPEKYKHLLFLDLPRLPPITLTSPLHKGIQLQLQSSLPIISTSIVSPSYPLFSVFFYFVPLLPFPTPCYRPYYSWLV